MFWEFAFMGVAIISFLVAFYFMKWGGDSSIHMDKSNSWRLSDPGGGAEFTRSLGIATT
jgi:hypothetical protein